MKNLIPSTLFLLLLTCLATPVQAKIYAQFTGAITTEGDAVEAAHENWVELSGFSAGIESIVSSGSGGPSSSRATFKTFDVSKYVDSATVGLMSTSVSGGFYSEVIIHVTAPSGSGSGAEVIILTIKLKNVFVQSVSMEHRKDNLTVDEKVSLVYEAHEITTYKLDIKTGAFVVSGTHTWNISTNSSTY